MTPPSIDVAPRSSFVTGLAWTFAVLGALTAAVALMQSIVLAVMLPAEDLREAMRATPGLPALPGVLLEYLRAAAGVVLALGVLTLASAIGLLRRKNWARIVFIVMMVLGAISNLAGAVLPYLALSWLPADLVPAPGELPDDVRRMMNLFAGFVAVTAVVFAVLFAWFAKRLMSAPVRREFDAG